MENNKIQYKIDLVQPNKVTNAKYDYTATQENVITCIMEGIQDHLTKEKPIQTDLFGHPTVRLKASDMAKGNTKSYVLQQLRELRKKDIDFSYVNPEGKTEDVTTGLINAIRNVRDTDFVDVEISTWAIPYLVYWGKGVGGTVFAKTIAVTLKSIYSKRIYKMCCRWQDQGGFSMYLDDLREVFSLQKKYTELYNFRARVLDTAKKELKEKADLYFEYDLTKVKSRSYNYVTFKIFSSKTKGKNNTTEWYQYVYNFICRTYPNYKNDKAFKIVEQLSLDPSQLRLAYNKFTAIDDEFSKGTKKLVDIIKLTKHILKEDFGIKN